MHRFAYPIPANRGEPMCTEELYDTLIQQMRAVHRKFPDLILEKDEGGRFTVTGTVGFCVSRDGEQVEDAYQIAIAVPGDYPQSVPNVKEVGGRISKDFHHYDDDTLCLGAPLEVRMGFAEHRSLLGYIQDQVVPFLYSHSYKERYGEMPYGELAHGDEGILESYEEIFEVDRVSVVLSLLRILAEGSYRGHTPCPCSSGRKLRKCHGPLLLKIGEHQDQDDFRRDFVKVFDHVKRDKDIRELFSVLPKGVVGPRRGKRKRKRSLSVA